MRFSKDLINQFWSQDKPDGRRLGQRFFDFFKLDKVSNPKDKVWADKLYNAPSTAEARRMIQGRIDR